MNVDRREVFEVSFLVPNGIACNPRYQKLRQYLDLEHRNKKRKPFDFSDWNDYDPEVRIPHGYSPDFTQPGTIVYATTRKWI